MANYIYNRVSSEAQDYAQQMKCINDYFEHMNIDPGIITEIFTEKVSGTINHTERELAVLMDKCVSDDKIYISELSRLGRNMGDLYNIVSELCDKGVTVIQCKDGTVIENTSIGGKALLFALSLAAEIEVENIRQRTKMGLADRLQRKREQGGWVSNTGRWCTRLGNEKGCDMSAANAASCRVKMDAAAAWRARSVGYKFVKRLHMEGYTFKQILTRFHEMAEIDPANYCTRTGKSLTGGSLSRWISEIDKELSINPND